MAEINVPCATCSGAGWATHEDRHTETRQDQCRACDGTGQVLARPGEARETSWPFAVPGAERPADKVEAPSLTPARQEEGSRGDRLALEVQARINAGRSRDGWEAWAPTPSHVLRIALRIDDEAVALLEAFSISGPWYANADAPDGKRHRLGAGSSLAGAVRWCERITGYVVTEDAAPTPDANSGGEAPVRVEDWQPIETAPQDTPYTADMPDDADGDAMGWAISDDDDRLLFLVWWEQTSAGRQTVTKWHPLPAAPHPSQEKGGDA